MIAQLVLCIMEYQENRDESVEMLSILLFQA